jgi:hypothetical protein
MKKLLSASLSVAAITSVSFAVSLNSNPNYVKLKNFHPVGVSNKECLSCHKLRDPGIVADWEHSKHAKMGVGCVQCHVVPKGYPTAMKPSAHPYYGKNWRVAVAVSSVTCAKCHAKEVEQYLNSGHARGGAQWLAGNGSSHGFLMSKLAYNYESLKGNNPTYGVSGAKMAKGIRTDGSVFNANQKTPEVANLNVANTCIQCHGTVIKLNKQGVPLPSTWPNDGIASLYPDGGVGNCVACHSRHKFSAAEARNPASCTNCHLGPDHPDKEVFESSVHGHIFATDESGYNFEANKVIPGKTVRAATCFVCHMSGINGLQPTHNVSLRLKWNLWAPHSFLRTGGHETAGWAFWKGGGKVVWGKTIIRGNPKAGNPKGPQAARVQMKQVCMACHEATFTNNYFQRVDAAIQIYNDYHSFATKMFKELKAKGLIKKDVWSDPFFKLYYYLWHHEGRRFRQGAAMGSPDYSHWHGVFQVMQDIREMKDIYDYRMKMYKKYNGNAQKVLENEPPMPVVTHE